MKAFFILSLILIYTFSYSQSDCFYINKSNDLAYSTKDSLLFNGSCINFYKNGKPKGQCDFKGGVLIDSKGWNEKGKLIDSLFYLNNKYGAFEKSTSFEHYKWWDNGNPMSVYTVKDWKSNGHYVRYYENGNKKEEGSSKMTKLDGLIKFYYKNGKIKYEDFYRNDSLIYSKHWDKKGNER